MSIFIGNYPSETITDNRFNFNSYINSNVIYLNNDQFSHPNAIINFKNDYEIGLSNSKFILNKTGKINLFSFDIDKSYFNNDVYIKSNLNTLNNSTIVHSNLLMKLYNNDNSFIVNDSNNNQLLSINNSNISLNINNKNKITITSNLVKFNENLTIDSNNYLTVNYIKSSSSNIPVTIDYIKYNSLDIIDNIARGSLVVNNDVIYNKPSFTINRIPVNSNIVEIYNSNINSNSKTKVFSINSNGFINIGENNSNIPINIQFPFNSNYPLIFNYLSSNDRFTINNRGYIGIGTVNPTNYINLLIKDDNRNLLNPPILNFDLNYNSNLNYRTSNIVSIKYIASSNLVPNYNILDDFINNSLVIYNNFNFNFQKTITTIDASVIPPFTTPFTYNIKVNNFINNDYIVNYGISNIISYAINSYNPDFSKIAYGAKLYKVDYSINLPDFITIDLNQIENVNPIGYFMNDNVYQIDFTSYIKKAGTTTPYNLNNFLLKEEIVNVYYDSINLFTVNLKQRLYIEKAIYELQNFTDTLTYNYQKPSDLIYATSNKQFSASLSSDGRLSLGDISPSDDYYLYINKKSRINNLECQYISSIPNKKNINFSYCNISNLNICVANSNICNYLDVKNGYFSNINISNLYIPEFTINNINTSNLNFTRIANPNVIIDSNLFNSRIKMIIGNGNYDQTITSNFILDINLNSNNNTGLGIFSFHSNTNPSLFLCGFSNNNFPMINLSNLNTSYSLNISNNNFNLINNNSNFIYKHNNQDNLFIIGGGVNSAIFDFKPVSIPNNSTNKIAFGYPYRYLTQTSGFNINNWETIFNTNQLNSSSMFNVYGNVNLSSINNTPFITCTANDLPSPFEVVNVCIGSNITRAGYLLNVEGNAFFSSNINVQSNVFAYGTIGNVSDIRIKENLSIISNPINKIDKLNGYIYNRKDTGKLESGLVAQEVMKVLPEVVNMNNDLYNISYGNLSGLLVEGIKELNNRLKSIEELLKSSNFSNNP